MTNDNTQDKPVLEIKQLQARQILKRTGQGMTIAEALKTFPEEEHEAWRVFIARLHLGSLIRQGARQDVITPEQAKELDQILDHVTLHYLDYLNPEGEAVTTPAPLQGDK